MLLNYYKEGNGKEIVVLLHSGGQTALSENELLRNKLKENHNVISIDLRGHGKSVTNDLEDYFDKCANDVVETLNALSINSCHVVGASLGALVALFIYKKNPELIQSMVLSGISMTKPDNWQQLSLEEDERLLEIIEMEEVIAFMNEIHEGDWRKVLTNDIGKDWYPFETTNLLNNVEKPVLICLGEYAHNELISIESYIKNDNIHIAVIPFAGHLVSELQPEMYTQIVLKFYDEII